MSMNFNYLLKYVIIGDSGVGKSNILLRYINNTFSEEFKATVGVEFGAKNLLSWMFKYAFIRYKL